MQLMIRESACEYDLFIRCESCRRETVRCVDVSDWDCPPSNIDELVESAYVARMPFSCGQCEGVIGRLFAVKLSR